MDFALAAKPHIHLRTGSRRVGGAREIQWEKEDAVVNGGRHVPHALAAGGEPRRRPEHQRVHGRSLQPWPRDLIALHRAGIRAHGLSAHSEPLLADHLPGRAALRHGDQHLLLARRADPDRRRQWIPGSHEGVRGGAFFAVHAHGASRVPHGRAVLRLHLHAVHRRAADPDLWRRGAAWPRQSGPRVGR
eukprot:scaffold1254_cov251-Pinguiococcus_pyrenoidosus.AAC.14